jgi:hypothetical protein
MKRLLVLFGTCLLLLTAASSCGGRSDRSRGIQGTHDGAPVLGGVSLASGKSVSGPPTGVIVTWPRVSDPQAIGYYLYRDTNPISWADPALRTNGGNLIDQVTDDPVVFYDAFSPVIGQTYYYRLSVVDIYDEESDLSNELSITIMPQVVTGIDPLSGYYGDILTVSGTDFGVYDSGVDHVYFMTDSLERLDAAIVSWDETVIQCTVPTGAITGPIQVQIVSTIAQSDDSFEILDPFLISVTPGYASYNEQITLLGDNLSDTPAAGDGITMPGDVFIAYNDPYVVSWSDTEIAVIVPPIVAPDGEITATVGGEETNGVPFSVRPAITDVNPPRMAAGSNNIVSITGFNFGDGSNGQLFIVDLSETDTADMVLVSAHHLVSWNNYEIKFRVPVAVYGALPALVVERDGLFSDPYTIAMLEPLAVNFLFPQPGTTLLTPTLFSVSSVTDVTRIDFYLGGTSAPFYVDNEGPDFSVTLDPADFTNGTYYLVARAYRGVDSIIGTINFDVLSLPGDTNGDGVIDDLDLTKLRAYFGTKSGDALYHLYLDPNQDGVISEADVALIGYYYTGGFGAP